MTPDIARHFKEAPYSRYPRAGRFTITEPDGTKRGVTLWHNRALGDATLDTPRFFEEEAEKFSRFVPDLNKMTRDNYHNLLDGLHIPPVAPDSDYREDAIIFATKPFRRVVQRLTVEGTEGAAPHRRIRKQTLRRRDIPTGIEVLGDYDMVIDRLAAAELIYANDFHHWTTGPQLTETPTRLNKPRR